MILSFGFCLSLFVREMEMIVRFRRLDSLPSYNHHKLDEEAFLMNEARAVHSMSGTHRRTWLIISDL